MLFHVLLPLLGEPFEPLKTLYSGVTDESNKFLRKIRKYELCFQMTYLGVEKVIIKPGFSPTSGGGRRRGNKKNLGMKIIWVGGFIVLNSCKSQT